MDSLRHDRTMHSVAVQEAATLSTVVVPLLGPEI